MNEDANRDRSATRLGNDPTLFTALRDLPHLSVKLLEILLEIKADTGGESPARVYEGREYGPSDGLRK